MSTYCQPNDTPPQAASIDAVYTLLQAMCEELNQLKNDLAIARPKETYTTDEAAKRLKRTAWTVRDWCNKGQVAGAYRVHGKGRRGEWRIPHDALVRVQNEGPGPATGHQQREVVSRTRG
jgi:transposase